MADFARSTNPQVQGQLDRLSKLSPAGDRLGLERIAALLERFERPQDRLPPVFHVAGTNGKGSTIAFLRAGLQAAGHDVHVFTSPHLVRFNERIRIAGRLIDDDELAALLAEVLDSGAGIEPSFFEVATAVAILAFARTPAAACILEVGLGGRLDATNVIERPAVCGIAGLGIDHQSFLGNDLLSIAREKAGIAKRGVVLVHLDYREDVTRLISEAAQAVGATTAAAFREWRYEVVGGLLQHSDEQGPLSVPLPTLEGPHQVDNCALALAMLRHQSAVEVPSAALERMPTEAVWPARFQRLRAGPLAGEAATWVDGAHNAEAASALAATLGERGPMHLVLGILANKDAEAIVGALAPCALSLTFVAVGDHPSHDPAVLAERFGGRAASSLSDALDGLPAPRLIAGSLYLAGEALAANAEIPD
jgi:dihydrofolate synthase/folylpolyglutamate synthase